MDDARFDALSRSIASRRTIMGGIAAGAALLAGHESDLLAKRKKKKKKKKRKKCRGGTVKCGNACVNTATDRQNCGACGKRCGGGETCVKGACTRSNPNPDPDPCPDGQQSCGGQCVDTQTDTRHCGACGTPCDRGHCVGGKCVECVDQSGCGGYANNDLVCHDGRCVCATEGHGLCRRFPDGRGACHQCCPGGNGECRYDEVCFYEDTQYGPSGWCNCPTGWQRCNYQPHPTGTCVEDPMTDPHKCGPFCEDCTLREAGSICCKGWCSRGCNIGSYCPESELCGPNCQPCNSDSICCNQGPGTEPRCIPNIYGGRCYQNI
jgi:hypothetical protein